MLLLRNAIEVTYVLWQRMGIVASLQIIKKRKTRWKFWNINLSKIISVEIELTQQKYQQDAAL
jgi:hypothetical protein